MKIFLTVLITIIVMILVDVLFIYSGIFNPGATAQNGGLIEWALVTTKNNSIESRVKDVTLPDLSNPSLINEGFEHYDEMCVMCHGAPGVDRSEIAEGLNPSPPELYEAKDPDAKEVFWAVKNGIKMTGMPSFGKTHSDDKITAITAFVTQKLPQMTAEDYQSLRKSMKGEHEEKGENEKSEE